LRRPGSGQAATVLAQASRAVTAILSGQTADEALSAFDASPYRASVRAISLGTVRWYLRLKPAVESLLARPRTLPREVRALLAVAAHQLEYSRNAPQLTVHAAVDAVKILRHKHAGGLINAVLRRLLADRQDIFAKVDRDPARRTAHPRWLADALLGAWPLHGLRSLEADNVHPPMTLRVNCMRCTPVDYLGALAAAGTAGRLIEWGADFAGPPAVVLDRPVPVAAVPGFPEGQVSVQDAGAQLAAPLLDARPGMRVLDACAAPGSKAAHLLELTGGQVDLWALDVDAGRLERVRENLSRLGLSAHVVAADVRDPGTFWDGRPFERILVDAPCSGTGVIRRHPDIKLLRRPEDIPALAATQLEILEAAFRMLAVGGRLLYSTCSVLPAENESVVERFLAHSPHARAISLPAERLAPGALACRMGAQLLCGGAAQTDGFYYACLEKTTSGTM
jgi:16S rRNA (cytosine967-C5)-methyltransferase